jgi:small-conductance mechanosensitive channel/CRP-like cAMP-binding protein
MLNHQSLIESIADPIVQAGSLAVVGALFTRITLRKYPIGRLVGQATFFVALTMLLLYRGIVPYDAGPSGVSVLERVFVDFAKVVWWANAAWVCAGFVRVFLIFNRQPQEERLVQDLVVGTIYLGTTLSVAANVFGVPVGTLIATSGVFAIILGLAMQSTLSDVFSGIALNVGRSFAIGDWIVLSGGIEGRVVERDWRATRLINATNDLVVVPNSDLAKARLTNLSGPDRSHGVTLTIGLTPTTRPAAIVDAMRTVLLSCNSILAHPEPTVQLKSLDARALVVELSFRATDLPTAATAQNEIFDLIYRHAKATGLRLSPPVEAPGVVLQSQDPLTPQQHATPLSVLNVTPLFASLTDVEKEALAKTMVRRTFHKDEVVVEQGAKLSSLMIVMRGALVVIRRDQQREIELNKFAPGDWFGESGLLKGAGAAGTIRALTFAVVYEIPQADLVPLMRDRPDVAGGLGLALSQRAEIESRLSGQLEEAPNVGSVPRLVTRIRQLFEVPHV